MIFPFKHEIFLLLNILQNKGLRNEIMQVIFYSQVQSVFKNVLFEMVINFDFLFLSYQPVINNF